MQFDYDLFVIGAGSGGVRAARIAAQAGAKVALAEEYRIGGTCVIRGCVPKKHLVFAAEFARGFAHARKYGWSAAPSFDWPTLRDNVQQETERLSQIYRVNAANAGVDLFEDRAELEGPHDVRLKRADRVIRAERILIAVGGAPSPLAIPGGEHAISSNEAFALEALPARIVVIGGGYIAAEFAAIFHGLGVQTTLAYRGATILNGFDDDIRAHVQAEMRQAGIDVRTDHAPTAIEKAGGAYRVSFANGQTIETDLVMAAVGRKPLTAGLGLEKAGVQIDAHGAIPVDEYSQTRVASIYAVGDVTNRVNLTPVAIREGHAFADTLYNDRPTKVDYMDIPTAVFSAPPVGAVGQTEKLARGTCKSVRVYKSVFRPMKHVVADDPQRTLMKIVVDGETDKVVGVHIAGPDGPEMIQLAAIAVKAGIAKAQWDQTMALHPTAAEELVLMRAPTE